MEQGPARRHRTRPPRSPDCVNPTSPGRRQARSTARYRAGLARLGHEPVPGGAPIVSVPGLAGRQEALLAEGVATAARAGRLRASFHRCNTEADVDRLLNLLEG